MCVCRLNLFVRETRIEERTDYSSGRGEYLGFLIVGGEKEKKEREEWDEVGEEGGFICEREELVFACLVGTGGWT